MKNLKKKNAAANTVAAFCGCWCGCNCVCGGSVNPYNFGYTPSYDTEGVQRARADQMQVRSMKVDD